MAASVGHTSTTKKCYQRRLIIVNDDKLTVRCEQQFPHGEHRKTVMRTLTLATHVNIGN